MKEFCVGAFWSGVAISVFSLMGAENTKDILNNAPIMFWTVCNGIGIMVFRK
jgi:hypothetical protein